MKLSKAVLIFCFFAISLIVYSQVSPPKATTKIPITDSTNVISLRDINQFNDLLKKSITYEQYIKLTPEAILSELWNWKMNQINSEKQLPDSTTNKKK